MQIIDSEILYNYIDTLSSEEFEGRLTGHIGYDKAAEWVITKFKEWGVKPLGTEDSFYKNSLTPIQKYLSLAKLNCTSTLKMVNS